MSAHALLQTAHRSALPADLKFLRRVDGPMLKESGHSRPSMPLKTLIVDDEPIARKVLREELESIEDIEIVGEADDGATALQKIMTHQPDLVLLDLQMPGLTGRDVQRQLAIDHVRVPIIVVTAHDQPTLREQCLADGAAAYVAKPLQRERLVNLIKDAIKRQAARRP